jgi:uncharacterized BrkB/YihY/UPF0761 family membrane protein
MGRMRGDRDPPSARRAWLDGRAEWARQQRGHVLERVEEAERRYPAVRFVLATLDNDRRAGGALLAGALAFRLFLWLLPACLVVVGGLGFLQSSDAQQAAREAGLSGFATSTISSATAQAHEARWVLLVTGLVALFYSSVTLARTMWVATTLAWQLPVVKLRGLPRAAALVVGLLLSALGIVLVANWLRSLNHTVGLVATLFMVVAYSLMGWLVLRMLPRPPGVSVADLLPGALLIGAGFEVLHLVTAFWLVRQLSNASQLYGELGGAATLLLWTYILARILIGATTVNRAWFAHRTSTVSGAL